MKFSVLIASYNNGRYLEECLDSILNQDYADIEIIVVDDCSQDHSMTLLEQFATNFPNIKVLRNEQNRGAGYTKKRCIDASSGELCGFVDPDDKLALHAVSLMVQKHRELENASLIYSTNYECDEQMNIVQISSWVKEQPVDVSVIQETYVGHFATFKRELYSQSIQMEPTFKRAVDHDLYCALEGVGPIVFVDEPLYYYRQHEGGISLKKNRYKAEFWDWIVKYRHASLRGVNLEEDYAKLMSNRIDAPGRAGRLLSNVYTVYLWCRKKVDKWI
ncbi:glycosyltransferase family 2 protein [Sphingobacterium wenxiniae]|uniref:Glycosyltransferase involved in cell wall bisynthesis n=1 Tax=Sphingobacterium wenxiniae TaxID=683125 RepID=A0A1I6U8D7_9SPHI|nr:glycosyltransferase [Sphingobacterium wenxiniae]SFS97736.1 Glycosyltransferase involved in cell wall bisynthesis [Sphingobacterium wenxiniae]